MTINIYSIYDKKLGEFSSALFCAKNHEVARRIIKQNKSDKIDYSDFALHCLGTFDPEQGILVGHTGFICELSDLFSD